MAAERCAICARLRPLAIASETVTIPNCDAASSARRLSALSRMPAIVPTPCDTSNRRQYSARERAHRRRFDSVRGLGGAGRRRSTMRVRWTWPVAAVRGRASTTATRRGCLNGASRPSQKARSSSTSGASVPARTHDDRGHDLAPLRVGDADDRDLGDGRMLARAPARPRAARRSRRRCGSRRAPGRRSRGSPRRRARRGHRCGTSRRGAPRPSRRERRSSRP